MRESMKTAVFNGVKNIEIETCDKPKATGNKVLVKIEACAICTWEQRVYSGVKSVEFPFIGGHEIAAEIVELGDDVNQSEWSIGDKVVVGVTLACRDCYFCKNGNEQSCEHFNHSAHLEGLPHKGMGGLSEYMLVRPDCLFKYYNVAPQEAAIIEPLSCVIQSVETADVQMGDNVLIIGCGIMGLLHIMLSVKQGATVIVSDMDESRLAVAKKLGAHYTVNPNQENVVEAVGKITNNIKAQVVFDTTPIPAVVGQAFECLSNMGKLVLYSSINPADDIPFNPNWIHNKSIKILGTANSNDANFMKAAAMVSSGIIDMKPFVSEVYPLADVEAAFESAIKADKFRVVVTM